MKISFITALSIIGFAAHSNTSGQGLLAVPTYSQVNKINGGLFGYRSVSTDTDTNGNRITVCENPGMHRCRVATEVVTGGGLTQEQFDEIDDLVTVAITPESTSGQFMYGEGHLVTYSYDITTGETTYKIYTYAEAVALGLL